MTSKKRTILILVSIIGTPVIFYALGGIISSFYPHQGSEWGLSLTWVILGFLSMFGSMLAGPTVSYICKNKNVKPYVSMLGYLAPPAVAFIVGVIASVSYFAGA